MKNKKKLVALGIAVVMGLAVTPPVYASPEVNQSIHVNPIVGISPDFIKGADVSMLKQIEISGGTFYDNGVAKDCLQILKDHGVNWVRLRIWNNPRVGGVDVGGGNNDEARTLALAARAKELGLKVLLDFHYSDFWADPGKQNKPAAWEKDSGVKLQRDVYDFTNKVMQDMKKQGTMPDMVQIGNELNNGMLWPDGQLGGTNTGGYPGFAGLLKQGIKAVRDNDADKNTKIMIHLADGGDNGLYRRVFDELVDKQQVTDFDVIGLSYYPYWHGTLDKLKNNMNDISQRYNKEVSVVETAYGFTFAEGDKEKNIFGPSEEAIGGYKAGVQGQATAVRNIMEAVSQVPNGKGLGIFYWEPTWIPVEGAAWKTGEGDGWENQALFDYKGNALPSLDVFKLVSDPKGEVVPNGTITSVFPVTVKAKVGQPLQLPSVVSAVYNDDGIKELPVVWDQNKPFDATGSYTATGRVNGTEITAAATITVVNEVNSLKNPGFETGDLSNWVIKGDVSAVNTVKTAGDVHDGGKVAMHYWAEKGFAFTASQTITGLKNGKYTARVWTQGGGGEKNLQLVASEYGGDKLVAVITNDGWNKWKQYVIKDINVTNGTCTIAVSVTGNAGNWGSIDDVELVAEN